MSIRVLWCAILTFQCFRSYRVVSIPDTLEVPFMNAGDANTSTRHPEDQLTGIETMCSPCWTSVRPSVALTICMELRRILEPRITYSTMCRCESIHFIVSTTEVADPADLAYPKKSRAVHMLMHSCHRMK